MSPNNFVSILIESLYELQQQGSLCDYTLQCVGGQILIHGCILAAASDYFKAMLSAPMVETSSKTIKLQIPIGTMNTIVGYLYSGQIELDHKNLQDVFKAAHELQISALISRCCAAFEANLVLDNALDMFLLGEHFHIPELTSITNRFLLQNIYELLKNDSFLEMLPPEIMRQLLESDDMVVPYEDSVLEFLRNWIEKDEAERTQYADEFKELIRFPHLQMKSIETLKKMGNCRNLTKMNDPHNWDLNSKLFKKRKYTNIHCHWIWQREDEALARNMMLSCGNLGMTDVVVFEGVTSRHAPKVFRLAIQSHTFYSCQAHTMKSLVNFNTASKETFLPVELFDFSSPLTASNFDYTERLSIRSITSSSNGQLYALVLDYINAKIFTLDDLGSFRLVTTIEDSPSADLCVKNQMAYLVGPGLIISSLDTDEFEDIEEEAPEESCLDLDWSYCIAVLQRDDILYLYHRSQDRSKKDFLKTYNLQTKTWGIAIRHGDSYCPDRDVQLKLIRNDIYAIMRNTPGELDEIVVVKKFNEKTASWDMVQVLQQTKCRFVGMAPVDTHDCERHTWLHTKCRSFIDTKELTEAGISLDSIRYLAQ